jgi:predicted aldo/keto reductase-like oxidoreductase
LVGGVGHYNRLTKVGSYYSVMGDFKPLNEEENAIIAQVTKIINENTAVKCTACEYCTHGCPKNIPIPKYFALYNSIMRTTGSFSSQMVYYNNIALNHGKASECIDCNQCEHACPQHLPITKHLKDVVEKFEKNSIIPTRK